MNYFVAQWPVMATIFVFLLALTKTIETISKNAEEKLDPGKLKEIANKLIKVRESGVPTSWVPNFILMFDNFFGNNHLSLRCFYRSVLISVVLYLALFVIHGGPSFVNEFFDRKFGLLYALLFAFVLNGIMDYASLLITRYILYWEFPLLLKLVTDACLTIVLCGSWLYVVNSSLIFDFNSIVGEITIRDYSSTSQNPYDSITRLDTLDWISIFAPLITTFSTSIWLWFHGLAEATIRGLKSIGPIMNWLNVREHPILSIGTVICMYSWGAGVCIALFTL